jgi:hypothetical protein
MAHHNPEDSAGAQLAMLVAIKLLLLPYKANTAAINALQTEFESLRASLLASNSEDNKIEAFNETAESMLQYLRSSA